MTWSMEILFAYFPDLKTMFDGKKGTQQVDRNVTIRTTFGQIDDSTIADESESTGIDGPEEPVIVNTTETANGNGSAVNYLDSLD